MKLKHLEFASQDWNRSLREWKADKSRTLYHSQSLFTINLPFDDIKISSSKRR